MADIERRAKTHLQPTLVRNAPPSDIKTQRLASPAVGRSRSNSESNGSRSQLPQLPPPLSSKPSPHFDQLSKQQDNPQLLVAPSLTSRAKCTHIIVLKPLNGTFETKYLIVPFKPDILKLGRPVVNASSGGGSGSGGSSRRDVSAMVRPDNGNFDSRVLSRSHACLNCDPKTGKICIRDLHSSNGTFVNGTRLGDNEVELKIGDIIDLGTDIDSKFEHKKISAFVEDISVIPLIDNTVVGISNLNANSDANANQTRDSHSQQTVSIKSPYSYGNTNEFGDISATTTLAQRAAFEAAMFGDVNNLNLEDAVLGPETEILSGIFINNSIGTSPNLINIMKSLATEIALEKQEYAKLKSIDNFLVGYTVNLEYINKVMVDMNDKQLLKLQNSLKQEFSEKRDKLIRETAEQLREVRAESESRQLECEQREKQRESKIRDLQMEIEDLKTRLEVERYKYTQLLESSQKRQTEKNSVILTERTTETSVDTRDLTPSESTVLKDATGPVGEGNYSQTTTGSEEKREELLEGKGQNKGMSYLKILKKYIRGNTLAITSISIGVLALIYKYSQRSAN